MVPVLTVMCTAQVGATEYVRVHIKQLCFTHAVRHSALSTQEAAMQD